MENFIGSRAMPEMVYHRPENMDQLMALFETITGEYKVVAGCTDFIPAIRGGRWRFDHGLTLIDINKVDGLNHITLEQGHDTDMVHIGAATPLSDIMASDVVQTHLPGLANAINEIASPQIRNLGTMAGNICMSSPAGDTIPPLLVLDATVTIKEKNGEREVPLDSFFTGPGKNILASHQVLTQINFPLPEKDESLHFKKMGTRDAMIISIASVASWVKMKGDVCTKARIALGSVAPTPVRTPDAEAFLSGKTLTRDVIDECAKKVAKEISPITDLRASADYRKDLAQTLSRRTLTACVQDLL